MALWQNFLVCALMRGVPFRDEVGREVDFSSYVLAYPWTSPKINWGANTGATADFTKEHFSTSEPPVLPSERGTMTNYSNNEQYGCFHERFPVLKKLL